MKTYKISPLLQSFFTIRLSQEKAVSYHTLRSYSTTFELLLRYAKNQLKKGPEKITLEDISAQFVSKFLNHLEEERNISPRTRNCRLAAIRSFFQYLSPKLPELSGHIAEVLSIPNKRTHQKPIDFLNEEEVNALLNAPDQKTWIGRRDRTILLMAIETGFRLSELIQLKWENVHFEKTTTVECLGKGRKYRSTPITNQLKNCLKEWAKENRGLSSNDVFPTIHGNQIGPDCVECLVKKYAKIVEQRCPSLKRKRVSPHVLRHTAAMRLLATGADPAAIALWLGHETIKTTYMYLSADMPMKEGILKKLVPPKTKLSHYKPTNQLMKFLKNQQNINKNKGNSKN
jgi:integrase/recombinase XerD